MPNGGRDCHWGLPAPRPNGREGVGDGTVLPNMGERRVEQASVDARSGFDGELRVGYQGKGQGEEPQEGEKELGEDHGWDCVTQYQSWGVNA